MGSGLSSAWHAVTISDPERLVHGMQGAALGATQLSRCPAASRLAKLWFPDGSCLDLVRLGPEMAFRGLTADGAYTLVFVDVCPEDGESFNFGVRHRDGYLGCFAPGGEIDARTPSGYSNVTLTVPAPVFQAWIGGWDVPAVDAIRSRGGAFRVPESAQRPLRALAVRVDRLMRDPERPLDLGPVRERLGAAARDAFLGALQAGLGERLPDPGLRMARRYVRLRQARDYVDEHLGEPLYLEDLAQATGLTSRAVEALFQDLLRVSPVRFLLHQRLHRVHGALLRAPAGPGVIKRAALEGGFRHLGRFSAEYRALFGRGPSETVAGRRC